MILFRAKTLSADEYFDFGEWVDGFYVCFNEEEHRIYTGFAETDCGSYYPDYYSVDPKTVRQYTGLCDNNGYMIFEGDIVKLDLVDSREIGVIKWSKADCRFKIYEDDYVGYGFDNTCTLEIIGNVYDNPELLTDCLHNINNF